jgi:hypothetical protein
MKKSLLINAALLAAVLLLCLVAWFKPSTGTAAFALSTLKASEVKSLEVVIGGSPPLLFARGERGWELAQPFAGRGDPMQIQKLLELLDAKSSVRLPAEGLARYGLNEPVARVKIADREFSFGAPNEMSREIYVLAADGIYLVPLRYAAALPKRPLDLVSKQLFAADEAPVAFDFGSFKVEQADGKWALQMTSTSVPAATASADDIQRWVDDWRLAGAIGLRPLGKTKPLGALQLKLKNGETVVIKVLERGDNTVVARGDEPLEYILSGETARRLLTPPGTLAAAAPASTPAK